MKPFSIRLLVLLVGLCSVLTTAVMADAQLRQCSKCKQYATSETWGYCPFCGTKLPDVKADKTQGKEDLIIGHIYKSANFGFQIELPNERWEFVQRGKGLEDINPSAKIGGVNEKLGAYFMVISEKFPGGNLKNYASLVKPNLQNLIKVYEKSEALSGLNWLKLKYTGNLNQIPFTFYYLITEDGTNKYQLITWCATETENPVLEAQINSFQKSFRVLKSQPL